MSVWPTRTFSRSPLLWLNFVCLDAPLVAVCWQWLFGQSFHLPIPMGNRIALCLTAWLIYLADRFSDSIALRSNQQKSQRQQFCLQYRNIWLCAIGCVAVVDAGVVLKAVNYKTLLPGGVLGLVTIAYVAINHAISEVWEIIPLKELAIGSLFAGGTLLSVTPNIFAERSTMLFAAILFALLCTLNCVSIATWERDLDRIQQKHSIATYWPAANFVVRLALPILAAGCVFLAACDLKLWPIAVCLGSSGLLLGALPLAPVLRDERTALADLVLLTPLLLLLAERIV